MEGKPQSTLAQGKRAGPITLRSVDRNYEVLFFQQQTHHASIPVGGVWPGESRNRFPAFHYIRRFIDSDSDFWHSCLLCDDINFSGFSFCRLRWRCPMTAFCGQSLVPYMYSDGCDSHK